MKNFRLILLAVTTLMLSACGDSKPLTPEEQGYQLGSKERKLEADYLQKRCNIYSEFINKFNSYGFQTRAEASKVLNDKLNASEEKYYQDRVKLENDIEAKSESFENYEDLGVFLKGYREGKQQSREQIEAEENAEIELENLRYEAEEVVRSIVVPEPKAEQVVADLKGKEAGYDNLEGTYWSSDKHSFSFAQENLEVSILGSERSNDHHWSTEPMSICTHTAQVVWTASSGVRFKADVQVVYKLSDEWSFETFKVLDFAPVEPNNSYKNKVRVTDNYTYVSINNNSSERLIVSGKIRYNNEPKRFLHIIEPKSREDLWYVSNCTIDFAERY